MQLIFFQNMKKYKATYKEQTQYSSEYKLFIGLSTDNETELIFHNKVLFYQLNIFSSLLIKQTLDFIKSKRLEI